MRENCTSGTVPGAPGNRSPYGGACYEQFRLGFIAHKASPGSKFVFFALHNAVSYCSFIVALRINSLNKTTK